MPFTVARGPIKRGELARRSGCNLETIRYYEDIGLMPPPARTEAGHRLYAEGDQRRLRFVLRARELGFSIEEIRSLLSMALSADYTCCEIHALTMEHLKTVAGKIADLKKLERTLSHTASCCDRSESQDCPIMDALSS